MSIGAEIIGKADEMESQLAEKRNKTKICANLGS